jgi:hypothetical protein
MYDAARVQLAPLAPDVEALSDVGPVELMAPVAGVRGGVGGRSERGGHAGKIGG